MHVLPTREGLAGNDQGAPVLPQLHPLWCTVNPDAGHAANSSIGMFRAPQVSAGRLVDVRPFGKRNPRAGGRPGSNWPGKSDGVRAPIQDETPLSAAEVEHGLWRGDL